MSNMLLGAIAFAYAVLVAFFARYYMRSRDRLFLIFAGAFFVLAVNRVLRAVIAHSEDYTALYVVRLFAYLLILWAIVDKNRSAQSSPSPTDTP
jgi:hypothetical protein